MRRFLLPFVVALAPVSAAAQSLGTFTVNASGTTCGTIGACAVYTSVPQTSMGIQIVGTFTGTLQFEFTTDASNWLSAAVTDPATGQLVTSTTGPGLWYLANVGYQGVRVRASALSSGSARVTAAKGAATGIIGSSTSGIPNFPILAPDGTAAAPSYSWANQPSLGFFRSANSNITIGLAGSNATTFNVGSGGTVQIRSDGNFGWTGGADSTGATDTTLGRGGASGKVMIAGATPMLQLGGTTNAFPALKASGNTLQCRLADDSSACSIVDAAHQATLSYSLGGSAILMVSATAPTIASGFGTGPSIPNNNGTAAFVVNVGTGATATNGVLTLPAAATGWNCFANDITAAAGHTGLQTRQTASTTTSATIESQNSAGAATAWATGSLIRLSCFAY